MTQVTGFSTSQSRSRCIPKYHCQPAYHLRVAGWLLGQHDPDIKFTRKRLLLGKHATTVWLPGRNRWIETTLRSISWLEPLSFLNAQWCVSHLVTHIISVSRVNTCIIRQVSNAGIVIDEAGNISGVPSGSSQK